MTNQTGKNQDRVHNLEKIIKKKIKENNELKLQEKNKKQETIRYQEIFNKSYLSIWEENPAEVYKTMESLPCNTGKDLTEYLSSHPETMIQMVTQLEIIEINTYTFILFGASNKSEFLETLKKGEILTAEVFPGFIHIFAAMQDRKSYCKTEISVFSIDGKKLKLLITAYIPGKGKGNMLLSMMDISERKNKEESISNSISRVSEQRKRTEVLQSILLTLTSTLDKEKILNAILLEAKKIVPYTSANIRLLENDLLKVVAAIGYDKFGAEDYIKKSFIKAKELGNALEILESEKINIISDTWLYPFWRAFPETAYIRGYIGLPFKWKGRNSGLLSLDSDKTDSFSESDKKKLEPFAHAITVALQNSYLFETTKIELDKRKQIEKIVKKSLGEKEILLREIHHRVKNNLSLVMSLINLQNDMVPNEINPGIFEDLKQRVYTISLVHEMLYNSTDLSSVDLKSYLIDLTGTIRGNSFFKHGITFQINIKDNIEIAADTLVPLALMLNEVLTNSVKHAFREKVGIISITVSIKKGEYKIIMRDNGVGFPENRKESTSLLGLDLVESMAAQIKGRVNYKNDGGAVTTILFPRT
jgi:two-component sensor histidine kinase